MLWAILLTTYPCYKAMECELCLEDFSATRDLLLPLVCPCGHSFCKSCLNALMVHATSKAAPSIQCPKCEKPLPRLQNIPVNFALLAFLKSGGSPRTSKEELSADGLEGLDGALDDVTVSGLDSAAMASVVMESLIAERARLVDRGKDSQLQIDFLASSLAENKNDAKQIFRSIRKIEQQIEALRRAPAGGEHVPPFQPTLPFTVNSRGLVAQQPVLPHPTPSPFSMAAGGMADPFCAFGASSAFGAFGQSQPAQTSAQNSSPQTTAFSSFGAKPNKPFFASNSSSCSRSSSSSSKSAHGKLIFGSPPPVTPFTPSQEPVALEVPFAQLAPVVPATTPIALSRLSFAHSPPLVQVQPFEATPKPAAINFDTVFALAFGTVPATASNAASSFSTSHGGAILPLHNPFSLQPCQPGGANFSSSPAVVPSTFSFPASPTIMPPTKPTRAPHQSPRVPSTNPIPFKFGSAVSSSSTNSSSTNNGAGISAFNWDSFPQNPPPPPPAADAPIRPFASSLSFTVGSLTPAGIGEESWDDDL